MADRTGRFWQFAWITWALVGVGSALIIIAAQELGWHTPPGVWWRWAIPGVLGGGTLELWALADRRRGDTLSEHVWSMDHGAKSFIIAVTLWFAWWLATGSAWPSAGIAFLLWFAWHVKFDGPRR